jgi:YtkA-like
MVGTMSLTFACSGSDAGTTNGFPDTPYESTTTAHQKISLELSTAPSQPPVAGLDAVQLILKDPTTGKPIEDESITLVPWMPTMGHGTDVIPQLHAMGKGRYVFTDVNLYMPGEWLLTFKFSGKVQESAYQVLFDVP